MSHARSSRLAPPPQSYECEVIPGLESIAVAELRRLGRGIAIERGGPEGSIAFRYDGAPAHLLDLQTVLAVYRVQRFPVPRPKALLGQQWFDALLGLIAEVRDLHETRAFHTFRISAAGQESSVLLRLRDELAQRTGLEDVPDEGDLLLRLRRPLDRSEGWDVLIRLGPRPLSVRDWRVCNLPGALNASVAHAMALLGQPNADDVVLNLACGSGTLLIERMRAAGARLAIGCDTDREARDCARENVQAAGLRHIAIEAWDAGRLPTPDAWVDLVLADLPFGQLVGSHDENVVLYPRLLREATRVTIGGGLFVALTEDIRLWEGLIADAAAHWTLDQVVPIKLPFVGGYLRPRIFVLRRK